MLKVKVFPIVDYIYSFLQTRGLLLVEDKENILYYTGKNPKELRTLLKEDKPDLLIFHNQDLISSLPPNIFWVYHPLRSEKDLFKVQKLYTNSYRLCQTYYQRLGVQAEIEVVSKKKRPEARNETSFTFPVNKFKAIWQKICQIMYWG